VALVHIIILLVTGIVVGFAGGLLGLGGVIGYIVNGIDIANLPPYSIGYVNLASWFLLALTSVGMAQVGAVAAHRLPARQLKYIFNIVMFYMGLKMTGVFDWFGWPV